MLNRWFIKSLPCRKTLQIKFVEFNPISCYSLFGPVICTYGHNAVRVSGGLGIFAPENEEVREEKRKLHNEKSSENSTQNSGKKTFRKETTLNTWAQTG